MLWKELGSRGGLSCCAKQPDLHPDIHAAVQEDFKQHNDLADLAHWKACSGGTAECGSGLGGGSAPVRRG